MSQESTPRILVPFAVLDGETVPPGVVGLLAGAHAVLLGYKELPEQTAPGQARMQFEERGEKLLGEVGDQFREGGASVETRLVFTQDREKTVDRVAREEDCHATLVVQPAPEIEAVYVALGPGDGAEPMGRVLAGLLGRLDADVSLRLFAGSADGRAEGDATLGAVADRLEEAGVDRDRIDSAVLDAAKAVEPIVEDAAGTDVVVMADPDVSIGEFLLGDIEDRIAGQLLAPVLVVRRETENGEG